MAKVRVTLLKSPIDQPVRNKRTLVALGLGKLNSSSDKEFTPQIAGMVRKVHHLVKVENI